MFGLAEVKDFLKSFDAISLSTIKEMSVSELNDLTVKQLVKNSCIIADYFYIGKLNNKKNKSIGVYQLRTSNEENIAVGGINTTKTMEKSVSILIHWNNNAKETEEKAFEIYQKLLKVREYSVGKYKINYIRLLTPEPIDVGTDDSNIYERVIQAVFYYEERKD